MKTYARVSCVGFLLLACLAGIGVPALGGDYSYQWHYLLTQRGRNNRIAEVAQGYRMGQKTGQCKVWVQNVVYEASWGEVWPPSNHSSYDWKWKSHRHVDIVAVDNWSVRMKRGQIIQAQVKLRNGGVGPHTMIVLDADSDSISVIESNYSGDERVGRRTFSRSKFRSSTVHFTLYEIE